MGLIFLFSGGWYSYEVFYARPQMAFLGVPKEIDWTQPKTWTRIFRNHGFMVGYSELRGNPLWVIYTLSKESENAPHLARPQRFSLDWRSLTRIGHEDYNNSGYDRGHMAPNHAISVLYGRSGQLDSFLMTNVTPQKPNLNQKLWQRLEEIELDRFAQRFGKVWVVTGPLFDQGVERLPSSFRVEIPDAFYKIYAVPQPSGLPKTLAFIIPQQVKGNEPLSRFVSTVDEVEKRSGFDFFWSLNDALERKVESSVDTDTWHLQEWSTLPGRYDYRKQSRRHQ
jgi:endonuclease G